MATVWAWRSRVSGLDCAEKAFDVDSTLVLTPFHIDFHVFPAAETRRRAHPIHLLPVSEFCFHRVLPD